MSKETIKAVLETFAREIAESASLGEVYRVPAASIEAAATSIEKLLHPEFFTLEQTDFDVDETARLFVAAARAHDYAERGEIAVIIALLARMALHIWQDDWIDAVNKIVSTRINDASFLQASKGRLQ
jgi:hypothetical protein